MHRRGAARSTGPGSVNGFGAVFTALVLVVVLFTKFTHGAYIVVIAMPALFVLMRAIKRHYDRVAVELRPAPAGVTLPSRVHAVVLVSRLHAPTLQALAYARATRPSTLVAVTAQTSPEETRALQAGVGRPGYPGRAGRARLPLPRRHRTHPRLHRTHPPRPARGM